MTLESAIRAAEWRWPFLEPPFDHRCHVTNESFHAIHSTTASSLTDKLRTDAHEQERARDAVDLMTISSHEDVGRILPSRFIKRDQICA
jgi:hypothetical protein